MGKLRQLSAERDRLYEVRDLEVGRVSAWAIALRGYAYRWKWWRRKRIKPIPAKRRLEFQAECRKRNLGHWRWRNGPRVVRPLIAKTWD